MTGSIKTKLTDTVVLVNPGRDRSMASVHPPMNLGVIASYLEKKGIKVKIIDEIAGEDVARALNKIRPKIVGITATTPLAPDAYRIAKLAKGLGCLTVMGGKHATILPEEAAKNVDIVVVGEGERAMLNIVRGKREKIMSVPYIENLDEIPPPSWHLMNMPFYLTGRDRAPRGHLYFLPAGIKVGCLVASRGCPFACIFCYNSWRNTPVRFHSAERVVNDIEFLIKRYKIKALYFMDDDLFVNKLRLKKICQLIKEKKIKLILGCQARATSVDLESLILAREAGLEQICFGFESGSQRILTLLKGKGPTVKRNAEVIKLCRRVGIRPFGSFMVGNPTETIKDLEATYNFVKKNELDWAGVHITTPFPGTKLWDWCLKRKLIPKNIDWSIFSMGGSSTPLCNTKISPEVIRRYRDKIEYYRSPLRPSQIIQRLLGDPRVIFTAIKHPILSINYLKNLTWEQ